MIMPDNPGDNELVSWGKILEMDLLLWGISHLCALFGGGLRLYFFSREIEDVGKVVLD